MELKKVKKTSQMEEVDKKMGKFSSFGRFDYDQKLEQLKDLQEGKQGPPSIVDSIVKGLTWGNRYVWDRSYEPSLDLSVSQRMKIINYCYDRFSFRAGKVSREISRLDYLPHNEWLKSRDLTSLKKYRRELETMREHNQFILTNEIWNCQFRAKYGSLLWGLVMGSAFCTIAIPKASLPKKALVVYLMSIASMYYSKVAFSERIIDVFYPFFRQDVEKSFSAEEIKASEAMMVLGKARPVHEKMTDAEKVLHQKRLAQLKEHTGLFVSRFDLQEQEQKMMKEKSSNQY